MCSLSNEAIFLSTVIARSLSNEAIFLSTVIARSLSDEAISRNNTDFYQPHPLYPPLLSRRGGRK